MEPNFFIRKRCEACNLAKGTYNTGRGQDGGGAALVAGRIMVKQVKALLGAV